LNSLASISQIRRLKSLAIIVALWFMIISLVFFYLIKLLFSGFLPFNGNFVRGQNNSKYRD